MGVKGGRQVGWGTGVRLGGEGGNPRQLRMVIL